MRDALLVATGYISNGVGTAVVSSNGVMLNAAFTCDSSRLDNPFGTQQANPRVNRDRVGATFILGTYSIGTTFTLSWQLSPNAITAGYLPAVYLSAADNHGLYTNSSTKTVWDWEADLGSLLGVLAANDTLVHTINIPYATLSPFFGTNISLVLGMNKDLDNSGARVNANSTCGIPFITAV